MPVNWDDLELVEEPSPPSWENLEPVDEPPQRPRGATGTWETPDELGVGEELRGVGRALERGVSRYTQQGDIRTLRKEDELSTSLNEANKLLDATPETDRRYRERLSRVESLESALRESRFTGAPETAAQSLAAEQGKIELLRPTEAQAEFQRPESSALSFFRNPVELAATTTAESLPAMVEGLVGGVAGPLGMAATTFQSSREGDSAARIIGSMQQAGVDIKRPEEVLDWFSNAASRPEIEKADRAALGPASFDAATAGLAGRILRLVLGKGAGKVLAGTAGEVGMQSAGGAAGSIAGSMLAGEEIDLKDVLLEAASEVLGAPGETVSNLRANAPVRPAELPRQTVAALERGAEAGLNKSVAAAADVVVKGDITIPDRIGAIDKQLAELEKEHGPRMVWDATKNRLVNNPETIRPSREDALVKLRDELGAQLPVEEAPAVQKPAPAPEVAPLKPAPGERLVTIEKPDGTTEQVSFGDKYWEMEDMKLASVARWTGKGWSHGMLREGERIVEPAKAANTQNIITKETVPERVVVQAEQVLENGEIVPGYVTIQSKGNAQSGPIEAWRAAGHEIPDASKMPSGTYTVEQLRAPKTGQPFTTQGFHGSRFKKDYSPFDPARTGGEFSGTQGVHVTPDASWARRQFANRFGTQGHVTAYDVSLENPFVTKEPAGTKNYVQQIAAKSKAAKEAGHDGIVFLDKNGKPVDVVSFSNERLAATRKSIPASVVEAEKVTLPPDYVKRGDEYVPAPEPTKAVEPVGAARAQPFFERESEVAGLGRSSLPPTVADVRAQRARDAATPDTIESTPLDPQSGAPIAPPAKPPTPPAPPAPPAPAAPAPGSQRATLDDVYQRFEPAPKERKGVRQVAGEALESVRTGFSSKFRPLNKLAEDVAKSVGAKAKDVAGIFEQLKGSSGKAEADVYRFDKEVSDSVKGSEKDFNAYMFLRRSLDRLNQDAADIGRAQAGENVGKLNRRAVSEYTIPQLEAKLATLSEQIGGEKLTKFNEAAEGYQRHMDQALQLQVESGRMSPEVYDAIKSGNQFYAPFKVMKYIEETMRPEGTGRKVDTTADFVKAMEGIEDPNFKLGDMLAAARQNLSLSRILAEKNKAMREISELSALDTEGLFVQKLKTGSEAPRGTRAVNVLENGDKQRYAVNENVAEAIDSLGPRSSNFLFRMAANIFRAGATTFNVPFQVSNILADTPRAALISKYGVNILPELVMYPFDAIYAKAKGIPLEKVNKRLAASATQSLRYPLSVIEGIYASFTGDVIGQKNKLMLDFLDSGVAGTTLQEYMTPGALRQTAPTTGSKAAAAAKNVLNTPMEVAQAVEQINKVAGVKQAMKAYGVESGGQLPAEAITELRRFSGSPDFGRTGKWVENYGLNLAQMFLNARIQGTVADVGRLLGRDGARQAASTWINLGAFVGLPSLYLYALNNRDEEAAENYAARPKQEKQNYWLVPKTNDDGTQRYIKNANGEKVPDYWRIPKRESAKWTGNFVEAGLEFAKDQNPETFNNWSVGLLEDMSPLNVQGKTLQERAESVAAGLNPILKAPLETATGRDLYRHRDIIPDSQKKASPEQQYDDRTPDVFKTLADKVPDVAPEVFRSPKMLENMTRNATAGLLTQFLPRKPVEGRTTTENNPLLQRFQALPYTDSTEFDERISKFERESADEQLTRFRTAQQIIKDYPGAKPDVLIKDVVQKHSADRKLAERVMDLYQAEQRGITPQERRILALPVAQRADYLAGELEGKTPEQKAALIRSWALKRVLTEQVVRELGERIK